jgi:hypothetical protein
MTPEEEQKLVHLVRNSQVDIEQAWTHYRVYEDTPKRLAETYYGPRLEESNDYREQLISLFPKLAEKMPPAMDHEALSAKIEQQYAVTNGVPNPRKQQEIEVKV